MSKYHYELYIDSETGRRLSDFWHRCNKAEKAARRFVRRIAGGDAEYIEEVSAFAGGCMAVYFLKKDPKTGKKVPYEPDGAKWKAIDTPEGEKCYVPNVRVEVRQDGSLDITSPSGLSQVVAIERMRRALPVVRTEEFYRLAGADYPRDMSVRNGETLPRFFVYGERLRYFIALDYPCKDNPDLREITQGEFAINMNDARQAERLRE